MNSARELTPATREMGLSATSASTMLKLLSAIQRTSLRSCPRKQWTYGPCHDNPMGKVEAVNLVQKTVSDPRARAKPTAGGVARNPTPAEYPPAFDGSGIRGAKRTRNNATHRPRSPPRGGRGLTILP